MVFLQNDAAGADLSSYLKKDDPLEQTVTGPVKYSNTVSDSLELATKAYADSLSQAAGATINDGAPSTSQVYSSSKTTTNISGSSVASVSLVNGAFVLTKGDGTQVTDTFTSDDIS